MFRHVSEPKLLGHGSCWGWGITKNSHLHFPTQLFAIKWLFTIILQAIVYG